MNDRLETIIRSPSGTERIRHPFFPALAVEIGLKQGLPLRTPIVNTVAHKLRENLEDGYLRWSEQYPADYDETIVARNVLDMLGDEQKEDLKLSFADNGCVYTYVGGTDAKANNSVDLLINLRILDYLLRKGSQHEDAKKIQEALKKQAERFREDIRDVSKYYVSNGFLIYSLAPAAEQLGIDIEKVADQKKVDLKQKTDLGLLVLASSVDIDSKYGSADASSLELFQHPRLQKLFSCSYFDEIVRACADQKISCDPTFDEFTAKIYDKVRSALYDYQKSAGDLSLLLEERGITKENGLVELAVGTGNFLIHMLQRGYKIHGVDVSDKMLGRARRKSEIYEDNVVLEDQNVANLRLSIPAEVIYTQNFIDIRQDGSVQFWATTETEAKEMLEAISRNLEHGGYFFVPKKQPKKTDGSFSLSVETTYDGNNVDNTYLYQDDEFTLRRSYKKIVYSPEEFSTFVSRLGWRREKENDSWVLYKKL